MGVGVVCVGGVGGVGCVCVEGGGGYFHFLLEHEYARTFNSAGLHPLGCDFVIKSVGTI